MNFRDKHACNPRENPRGRGADVGVDASRRCSECGVRHLFGDTTLASGLAPLGGAMKFGKVFRSEQPEHSAAVFLDYKLLKQQLKCTGKAATAAFTWRQVMQGRPRERVAVQLSPRLRLYPQPCGSSFCSIRWRASTSPSRSRSCFSQPDLKSCNH